MFIWAKHDGGAQHLYAFVYICMHAFAFRFPVPSGFWVLSPFAVFQAWVWSSIPQGCDQRPISGRRQTFAWPDQVGFSLSVGQLVGLQHFGHGFKWFSPMWRFPLSWGHPKIDAFFHGKSHLEMDDWGVPPFMETSGFVWKSGTPNPTMVIIIWTTRVSQVWV